MELRATLARLRKENGFSQAELAEELGVTRQAVSRWETGAAAPTTDNLICLSQLFGVTMDELVTGRSAPPDAGVEVPPFPDAESSEAEPPDARVKVVLTAILVLCLFSGTLMWGKLTNSLIHAIDYLFWEIILLVVGSIIMFVWRKYKNE